MDGQPGKPLNPTPSARRRVPAAGAPRDVRDPRPPRCGRL